MSNVSLNSSSACGTLMCYAKECRHHSSTLIWVGVHVCVLLIGLVLNISLIWTLVKGSRNTVSPSSSTQLLSLNVAVINVIFLCALPLDISTRLAPLAFSSTVHNISWTFSTLNIFSSSLLLTSMCVERFIAVSLPLLYMRLGKGRNGHRTHTTVWCVVIWLLTVLAIVLVYEFKIEHLLSAFCIFNVIFLLVMLSCICGIVRSLCRKSPAQGDVDMNPMKKKALVNILSVMVPMMITYSPGLLVISSSYPALDCDVFSLINGFYVFGVLIGPMFYLTRTVQLSCLRNTI